MKAKIAILICAVPLLFIRSVMHDPEPPTSLELGKRLFFDPILSGNRSISCGSCHKESLAFADSVQVSQGVNGRMGTRNTPSAMNMRFQESFFWDGRATTLEQQVLMPIENPVEMDLPVDSAIARLNRDAFYRQSFLRIFKELPSKSNLARALSDFERSLETGDSPFDDWRVNDNEDAVSASAKRGFKLFNTKAKCIQCHFGPDFKNVEFRNIGLFDGKMHADSGRSAISHQASDLGKFKIGSLRNIAITAPYMHNGMFKTLKEVINYYNDPEAIVPNAVNRDTILTGSLQLTEAEKLDIENFLIALTDRRFLK
ncbi:cytochrome-c peroxidase [Dyadobacter chenhuakuii]|uniref:Cytochrome-c peroxidase n=1 Tax=Dyadobacter chenhuakuii TaxID=2909339 RepID=A0ABY4XLR2_9BACT|nr:cytochrome c peroxidase [Dyadobacter chenhuakuii]MCF2494049.1 cytochrome-c peroxidase [Dyadobacter chenhuakuii]USJ31178.1 cytochrome-c peroxidase [Dyadobacter chenhuakuii]